MTNLSVRTYISIVIIAIVGLWVNSCLKNYDTQAVIDKVSKDISSISDQEVYIENIDFKPFPYPSLVARRITLNKGIFIDRATIYPNIFSIILGKFEPSIIEANNVYINPKKTGIDYKSSNQLVSLISGIDNKFKTLYIKKIWDTAVNNRVIISDLSLSKNNKNLKSNFILFEKIKLQDETKFNSKNAEFSSNTKISNSNFSIKINRIYNQSKSLSGEFSGEVNNLALFVKDISSYYNFIISDYIKSSKKLKFSGRIINDENHSIFDQIKIENPDISIIASLKNSIITDENLIDLQIQKLNLAEIMSGQDYNFEEEDSISNITNSNFKLNISGNNITYPNITINNFILSGQSDGQSFLINNCTGNLSNEGAFGLSGSISDNKLRPKFDGFIRVNHNNFNKLITIPSLSNTNEQKVIGMNFSSDISLTPVDLTFKDSKLSFGGQIIRGGANLKFIGKDKLLFGDFIIDDIDIENSNIPLLGSIYDYFKSLGMGMNEQSYAAKYTNLRNLPIKTTINLTGDNIFIDGKDIERLSLIASLESGLLRIDNYSIDFGDSYILGNGKIIANSVKPQIKLDIIDGEINIPSLPNSDIERFLSYFNNNFSFSSINFSSEGFLKSIKIGEENTQNLSWSSETKNGILVIEKIAGNLFNGNLNATGNLLLNPLKLNFIFGLDGFKIEKLLNLLPQKTAINSGFASMNGQLSSVGVSADQIFQNLYMKGEFLSKKLEISGIDLENLITKLSTKEITEPNAQIFIDESINSGKSTFEDIKGKYELINNIATMSDVIINSGYYTSSLGIVFSTYDYSMDLNSIINFYPIGAKIFSPSSTPPIKLRLISKGSIFGAEKLLKFENANDVARIPKLLNISNI